MIAAFVLPFRNAQVSKIQRLVAVNEDDVNFSTGWLIASRARQTSEPKLAADAFVFPEQHIARLLFRIANLADGDDGMRGSDFEIVPSRPLVVAPPKIERPLPALAKTLESVINCPLNDAAMLRARDVEDRFTVDDSLGGLVGRLECSRYQGAVGT